MGTTVGAASSRSYPSPGVNYRRGPQRVGTLGAVSASTARRGTRMPVTSLSCRSDLTEEVVAAPVRGSSQPHSNRRRYGQAKRPGRESGSPSSMESSQTYRTE
jgi:hypothetical protein